MTHTTWARFLTWDKQTHFTTTHMAWGNPLGPWTEDMVHLGRASMEASSLHPEGSSLHTAEAQCAQLSHRDWKRLEGLTLKAPSYSATKPQYQHCLYPPAKKKCQQPCPQNTLEEGRQGKRHSKRWISIWINFSNMTSNKFFLWHVSWANSLVSLLNPFNVSLPQKHKQSPSHGSSNGIIKMPHTLQL